MYATALPTELKEISTNTVSRGGYEPTTVTITSIRGAYPLHSRVIISWRYLNSTRPDLQFWPSLFSSSTYQTSFVSFFVCQWWIYLPDKFCQLLHMTMVDILTRQVLSASSYDNGGYTYQTSFVSFFIWQWWIDSK
jgi:hypothetical protein